MVRWGIDLRDRGILKEEILIISIRRDVSLVILRE